MVDTLKSLQVINYQKQQIATFGHLAPKPNILQTGFILFTLTAFGDTCIIDFDFTNIESSPWFNSDILDYISDYTASLPKEKEHGVFVFEGSYKKYKNGNFKFKGSVKEIETGLNN